MNKINRLFSERGDRKLLSLYFCAGCPKLDMTADVILSLQSHGIDMIEVGIPFSDPLADGPVIQSAGTVALKNGMTLEKLFAQLDAIKSEVKIPLVLMGYLNVIMHYGYERFCKRCVECGVSGFIIPDLPSVLSTIIQMALFIWLVRQASQVRKRVLMRPSSNISAASTPCSCAILV